MVRLGTNLGARWCAVSLGEEIADRLKGLRCWNAMLTTCTGRIQLVRQIVIHIKAGHQMKPASYSRKSMLTADVDDG